MITELFGNSPDVEIRHQDAVDLLCSLDSDSVDLILTDPPYGISYQSNMGDSKGAPILGDWEFEIEPVLREVGRALVDGGVAYIFTRWDVYPNWVKSIPEGLALKNIIVWDKKAHTAGDLKGNFGFRHEFLMMLVKGRHTLRGHRHPNLWAHSRIPPKNLTHPAEKPQAILRKAIKASTDKGGLVVDPFCGTGSTGLAAAALGRRAILGDLDLRWLRKAVERLGLQLPVEWEVPKTTRSLSREAPLCVDALKGIHPEDIAALIQEWNGE